MDAIKVKFEAYIDDIKGMIHYCVFVMPIKTGMIGFSIVARNTIITGFEPLWHTSSYVARGHLFSRVRNLILRICERIGHDLGATTQVYLASSYGSAVDKANNLRLKLLQMESV